MLQPHSLSELVIYLAIIWLWYFGIVWASWKFLKNDNKKKTQ
jgi:hypothetical protein